MLKDKKLFLFDIDGTIAIGDTLYEGSKELLDYIESVGGKAYYITNNSTKSNEDYVKKFEKSLKKVRQKFGGLIFLLYLCTTFRSEKLEHESLRKWFFDLLVFYIERKV